MDPSQLPPGAAEALQQSGVSGDNLTQLFAQLANMSPEEVSAALQQLGIDIDPETLHDTAAKWVDDNAGELADKGGEATPAGADEEATPEPAADAAPTDDEAAEPAPDNEQAEGEDAQASASPEDVAAAQQASGGMPMPMRGPPGGAGGMDAAISQMMGGGGGARMPPRPGAMPGAGAGGRPPAGAIPMPGPAAGEDPRAKAMISSIYRQQMGPGSGAASSRVGIPLGPRTGGEPGATSSPLTRMKKPKKQ